MAGRGWIRLATSSAKPSTSSNASRWSTPTPSTTRRASTIPRSTRNRGRWCSRSGATPTRSTKCSRKRVTRASGTPSRSSALATRSIRALRKNRSRSNRSDRSGCSDRSRSSCLSSARSWLAIDISLDDLATTDRVMCDRHFQWSLRQNDPNVPNDSNDPNGKIIPVHQGTYDAPLQDVLSRYWGYTAFRPLQREAMEAILDGRDSITVLPTGGGKSLCFQAPALLRAGVAVVVSPLISLMKDQVDTL